MKKTILACVAVAAISTNCSAAEVVGTVDTIARTAATVTTTAHQAVGGDNEETVKEEETHGFSKWWDSATGKYDEVVGGRKAIATLQQENSDLKVELRTLKAKTSFVGANIQPFSVALEKVCFLYDGGGIKEALGAK